MKVIDGIKFLEVVDFKKDLKFGNTTVYNMFHMKGFPGMKIGKTWMVMEDAFKEFCKYHALPRENEYENER